MNEFLHVGFDTYVNVAKVRIITAMDSDKLRREMVKRRIDKKSNMFWNSVGNKEIKSLIFCDDGMLITSAINATTLIKRFNEMKQGG